MKKQLFSLCLSVCLLLSCAAPAWAAESETTVIQTVQALGIMTGDLNGQMDLDRSVSRAELTRMMAAMSPYKDTISGEGSGYSLFKDVKNTHWASEYIRLAVEQGWVVGYTDGSFRPDQTVTLEEACTALLRLLGYTAADLAGSFPYAQLNKAAALGIRDQVTAKQGDALTRRSCMYLFYNALTARTPDGRTYAAALGYTLTGGKVDYTAILSGSLSGPYVYDGKTLNLPFDAAGAKVYRDGKASTLSALSEYDVYYYNAGVQTVWMYTARISGAVAALSPNGTSPSAVTVAGRTYAVSSPDASYALSALNGTKEGTMVTLLLGMDGSVVSVLTGAAVDTTYYGVVQSCEKAVSTAGDAAVQTQVQLACTDGNVHMFRLDQTASYAEGTLLSVTVTDGKTTAKQFKSGSLSGTVSRDAAKLGDLAFADNVHILDTGKSGGYAAVTPQRLAGRSLSGTDVRAYVLDSAGRISHLILNDVTGDIWTYGYLISVEEVTTSEGVFLQPAAYRCMVDGGERTLTAQSTRYPVSAGQGIALRCKSDGAVEQMKTIASVRLTQLGTTTARADNRTYDLSGNVQVYLRQNGAYFATDLSAVDDQKYVLMGYYDNFGCPAGGLIRVIVATPK